MSPIKKGLLFIFINFIFISLSIANHSNQTNAISNDNRYRRSITVASVATFVGLTLAGNLVGKSAAKIMDKLVCEKLNPEKIFHPVQVPIKLYCKYLRDTDESAVINEKLDNIQNDLKSMSSSIAQMEQTLRELKDKISEMSSILPILTEFTSIRLKLQSKISVLNKYKELDGELMNVTIKEFRKDVSGYRTDSMPDLLRRFHDTLFDDNAKLLKYFCKGIKGKHSIGTAESLQDKIYQFYLSLMSFEVQSILAFSYKLEMLKILTAQAYKKEKQVFQNLADERMNRLKQEFIRILDESDRSLYKLDPGYHQEDRTYIAITRFHQFYIANEAFFYTCSDKCGDFKPKRYNFNDRETYTEQQRCEGVLYDCHYFENCNTDYYGYLPDSSSHHMRYSSMYLWRRESSGCVRSWHGKAISDGRVMKFHNWKRGFFRCDACACTCDEPNSSKTVRKFSLSPVLADTARNYVITGIRFAKINGIIILQIQQSKLLPKGIIDTSTSDWRQAKSYSSNVVTVTTDSTIKAGSSSGYYHNDVLIGVALKSKGSDNDLSVQFKYARINYKNGEIQENDRSWDDASCSSCQTYRSTKDNPTLYKNNRPNGKDGYYYFRRSSLESDVGQTTIPFFDAQDVTSSFAPIASIDLHIRDNSESGGFVAFKLKTLNFARFIE